MLFRSLESDDTAALRGCLEAMGAAIVPTREGLRVSGPLRGVPDREIVLDAADSGTAARFLAGRVFSDWSQTVVASFTVGLVRKSRGYVGRFASAPMNIIMFVIQIFTILIYSKYLTNIEIAMILGSCMNQSTIWLQLAPRYECAGTTWG